MDVFRMFPAQVQSRTEIVICIIMDYVEWFTKYLPEWFTSRMFQFCQDKYQLYCHQNWGVDK